MGLFSSKSSSRTTTTATETGQQASDEGLNLNFGNIATGKKSNSPISFDVDIQKTDFGAIEDSFTFAAGTTELALQNAAALNEEVLLFSGGAIESAFGAVEDSIAASEAARADILQFSAGAIQNQTELVTQTFGDATALVDKGLNQFLTASAQQSSDAIDAVQLANQNALTTVQTAAQDAFTFGAGTIQELIDFTGEAFGAIVTGTSENVTELGLAQERTIAAISDATRSDSAANFDKLVKVTGIAFVALAVVTVFLQSR